MDVRDLQLARLSLRSLAAFAARCAERMAPLHSFATGAEVLRGSTDTVWDFAGGRDLNWITTSHLAGGLGVHVLGLVEHFAGAVLTPEQVRDIKGLPAGIADVFGLAGEMLRVHEFDLIEHLSRHTFDARESCSGWDGVAIAAGTASKALYSVAYAAEAVGLSADRRSNSTTFVQAYVRAREAAEISVLVGGATAYKAAVNDLEVLAARCPSVWGDVGGAVARHELPPLWPEGPPETFPTSETRRDALDVYLTFRGFQRSDVIPLTGAFEERLFESTALFEGRMAFFLNLMLSKEFKRAVWRPTYHVVPVPEFDIKVVPLEERAHVFVTGGAVAFFEFVAHSLAFEDLVGGAAESSEVMKASVFGAGITSSWPRTTKPALVIDSRPGSGSRARPAESPRPRPPEPVPPSAPSGRSATSTDKGHGRLGKRTLEVTRILTVSPMWKGLEQGFKVTRERVVKGVRTARAIRRSRAGSRACSDSSRCTRRGW